MRHTDMIQLWGRGIKQHLLRILEPCCLIGVLLTLVPHTSIAGDLRCGETNCTFRLTWELCTARSLPVAQEAVTSPRSPPSPSTLSTLLPGAVTLAEILL